MLLAVLPAYVDDDVGCPCPVDWAGLAFVSVYRDAAIGRKECESFSYGTVGTSFGELTARPVDFNEFIWPRFLMSFIFS